MGIAISSVAQFEMELQRAKVLQHDLIKSYVRLPDLQQKRMVEFAHSIGVPVASHEIYPAAFIGADNTEHTGATSRRGYSPKIATLQRSYEDVIQLFGKSGRILCPMISGGGARKLFETEPELKNDPRFRLYPEWIQRQVAAQPNTGNPGGGGDPAGGSGKMVMDAMRAGALIVAGTDTPNAINLHGELMAYTQAGMTPYEALKAATVNPAQALGLDAGTIDAGKLADLVFVDGDPLVNIANAHKVRRVIANGRLYELTIWARVGGADEQRGMVSGLDELSVDERQMLEETERFACGQLYPLAARMDTEEWWPDDLFPQLGAAGYLGITVPEAYGGVGADLFASGLVLEAFSRWNHAIALSWVAHENLCLNNLYRNGTEEQRRRFLPGLCSGTAIGALALTEPGAGSDAIGSMRSTARRDGDVYVLNGTKMFITNGPVADVFIVYARIHGGDDPRRVVALIVEKGCPGFTVAQKLRKMGFRGSQTAELVFQDCRVPGENVLGGADGGLVVMMGGLDLERAMISPICLGIAERALPLSLEHAKARAVWPAIANFQMIRAKLMTYVWVETMRPASPTGAATRSDVEIGESGRGRFTAERRVVMYASESLNKVLNEALQIPGGGYIWSRDQSTHRANKLLEIGAGTTEIGVDHQPGAVESTSLARRGVTSFGLAGEDTKSCHEITKGASVLRRGVTAFLRTGAMHRVGPAIVFELCLAVAATNEANVAEILSTIGFKRLNFRCVARGDRVHPVKPDVPAIRHGVSQRDVHDAGAFPVPSPPCCRMEAPEVLGPPRAQMIGNRAFDFLNQSGPGNRHRAARLHEFGEVVQVQVVRPEVGERINAHDSVEEVRGEGGDQHRMDRNTPSIRRRPGCAGCSRGADPKVGAQT
jgi:isovaleryl-CoA dehydrogenase